MCYLDRTFHVLPTKLLPNLDASCVPVIRRRQNQLINSTFRATQTGGVYESHSDAAAMDGCANAACDNQKLSHHGAKKTSVPLRIFQKHKNNAKKIKRGDPHGFAPQTCMFRLCFDFDWKSALRAVGHGHHLRNGL